MSVNKCTSYSSSKIQRATRINGIESVRLEQRLGYIERAKTRQCRLTNQDIRLISTSMIYIQSSSGQSHEATHPGSSVLGDTQPLQTSPCFMYGERIWNRKRKRRQRPISAFRRSAQAWNSESAQLSCGTSHENQTRGKNRPLSVADIRDTINCERRYFTTSACELDHDAGMSVGCPSRSKDRLTPRQAWEDDISEVTKKILNAQVRGEVDKRQSVYESHREGMSRLSSRHVRDLLRKIRISATSVF